MSDRLAALLRDAAPNKPLKSEDPDQRVIDALAKALEFTTPERPGCPWDESEEEIEQRSPGYWLPEGH